MSKTTKTNKLDALMRKVLKTPLDQRCEFCDRLATYVTQDVYGEAALSRSIYHCQAHRDNAITFAKEKSIQRGV